MKARKSQIQDLIELLISSFKRSKNLPYPIRTNLCPKSKKNCTRHHGEIVVESYDSNTKLFHCIYYGVHIAKKIYETDQTEDLIRNMIKKSLTKLYHGKKPMVTVKELKKFLYSMRKTTDNSPMTFRCSYEVKEIIRSNAKNLGLDVSEYIISKLLS